MDIVNLCMSRGLFLSDPAIRMNSARKTRTTESEGRKDSLTEEGAVRVREAIYLCELMKPECWRSEVSHLSRDEQRTVNVDSGSWHSK
jgi:hypothetical protein